MKSNKKILLLIFILIAVPASATTEGEADALFQAQDWAAAAEAYQALTREQPTAGTAWFRLGYARYRQEHYSEALAAYDHALDHGVKTVRLLATAALSHQGLGHAEAAMDKLAEAVEAGLPPLALENNPAFAFAKDHPRFAVLVARAEKRAFPCRQDARSRQFDFWIGDWDVSAAGNIAGHNVITSQHEGCLILESYTTARGYSGQSFNFYDPVLESWRQIWVDTGGNVIWYEGHLVDGEMRFAGKLVQHDGKQQLSRMTFTPNADGSVRQFVESSTDEGKTWTVGFDGLYEKRSGK